MRAFHATVAVMLVGACAASTPRTLATAPAAADTAAAPVPAAPAAPAAPNAPTPTLAAVQPWIGLSLAPGTRGVRVKQPIPDTPGARAGIAADDEVLALDGAAVHTPAELIAAVRRKGVGANVAVQLARGDHELTVELALEAKPDAIALLHRKLLGQRAPAFSLVDVGSGQPIELASLAGKVVVLEFGATWCHFCMSTLPALAELQAKHAADLRVVWISSEPADTIRSLGGAEIPFARARDADDQLAGAYAVQALPTLIVIDRTGIVRAAEMGAGDTVDEIIAAAVQLTGV